ncbi:MAG: hypothetical protein AAF604_02100 [Acidobacteriota bacterium]
MSKKLLLTLIVVAGALALLSSWASAGKQQLVAGTIEDLSTEPFDCHEACGHLIAVADLGTFDAQMTGSLTARVGQTYNDGGRGAVTVEILGSSMRGYVEGLGETRLWLDRDRPLDGSFLRENQPGTGFPATQEMYSHLVLQTEALPGRTFRTLNPFSVRSENLDSWPPSGARFELMGTVEFEDVDTGEVVVTMSRGSAIVGGG